MSEILEIVLRNFWTFLGTLLLLGVITRFIVQLARGHEPKNYSDPEIVAVYKMGKMDQKNGYHFLDDDAIINEIQLFLKNGRKTRSSRN